MTDSEHSLAEEPRADRLLRLSQVIAITGIGKTMIYRLMRQQRFPQPYKPGGYASRWSESEVQAWRESQRSINGC